MPMTSPDPRVSALEAALAGRYEFLSLLGEGGFSNVYSVRNQALGRVEALKVLLHSPGGRDAVEFTTRFEQEARIVAALDHPHIVKVFDFGSSAGIHWFSMQFIPGPSLSDKIDHHAPMPEAMAVEILLPILDALEYAHQRGIVHRDLKPANILFDAEGRPYVTDFGLAKPKGSPGLTRTNVLMGTPHFLAPEQVRGRTLDHRSDLYSLSVTLYEMLTATTPFSSYEGMEAIVAKLSHDPTPARKLRPDLALAFDGVLSRGLARHPDNRFQSAREMAQALERALERRDEWLTLEAPAKDHEEELFDETVFGDEQEAREVPELREKANVPAVLGKPGDTGPKGPEQNEPPTPLAGGPDSVSRQKRVRQLLLALASGALLTAAVIAIRSRGPEDAALSTSRATPMPVTPAVLATATPEVRLSETGARVAPEPRATAVPSPAGRAVAPDPTQPAKNVLERPATPPVQISDGDAEALSGMPETCAGTSVQAIVVVDAAGSVTSARPLSKGHAECWTFGERFLRTLRFEPAKTSAGAPVESGPLAVSVTLGTPRNAP